MPATLIQLATPDGPCTTEVVRPNGSGPWPAVIEFFDAAGLRPAQTRIAERIAAMGYIVFQPDLFHRTKPIASLLGVEATLLSVMKVFSEPELKTRFMADYYLPALDYGNLEKTIGALLNHIDAQPDVRGGIGTTGYCMGGNVSVRVAIIFGNRIAATAAFHPGGLVTDHPQSPHLRIQDIKSNVYLGPAVGDLPPEAEATVRNAFEAAHVSYEIEQYDAKHGYAIDDGSVYDKAADERHYQALKKLFGAAL